MIDPIIARRAVPHYSNNKWCLFSFDNQILRYTYADNRFDKLTYLAGKKEGLPLFLKEKVLRNYLYKRYLTNTFGIHHISANNEYLIALYGGLYFHPLAEKYAKARRNTAFDQLNVTPPLFQGIAVHAKSQHFYFGEYVCGEKRDIRIIRITHDLKNIEIAYTFKDNPIQHVHGVFYDHFLNRLWITTGDSNEECGIYYTDDEFNSVHLLGGGDQSWRAVSVIPTSSCLIWGTDAGKDARKEDVNLIYSYDYVKKERTCEAHIGNPAYHSIVDDQNNIFIGTNFEPGRKQVTREESAIWMFNGNEWNQIRTYPYRLGKTKGCSKYGYVYFPKGTAPAGRIPFLIRNSTYDKFAMRSLNTR